MAKKNTVIIGDFTLHCQQSKDCPNKNQQEHWGIDWEPRSMDLIDICRIFPPKEAKYTFFSQAHG